MVQGVGCPVWHEGKAGEGRWAEWWIRDGELDAIGGFTEGVERRVGSGVEFFFCRARGWVESL
jgi:hypothetical protein